MSFDKFVWIKALMADKVPFRAKSVGALCAIQWVTYGENSFAVRQDLIAERCGTTRKTVNDALSDLKRAGYLVKGKPRDQGPRCHGGDEWLLAFPGECCNQTEHHQTCCNQTEHHPESGVTESPEWCNQTGDSGVTESAEWCNRPNAPTSEDDPPKVLKKVFEKGLHKGSGQTPRATIEEQLHAPGGADLDEKTTRPWFSGGVHKVVKSTNIANAGRPPSPKRNGTTPGSAVVPEKLDPWVERLKGTSDCELCDGDGYLPDDSQCFHGKARPA